VPKREARCSTDAEIKVSSAGEVAGVAVAAVRHTEIRRQRLHYDWRLAIDGVFKR
jgi:hypothetical protein